MEKVVDLLFDRPSRRLVVYGTLAPGEANESILAGVQGAWEVDLKLEEREPPETLYHGTVERFLPSILEQGLVRGKRHHVHLSEDVETARKVGARRGKPVILTVDAGRMHRERHKFLLSANGVWLTHAIPPGYLSRAEGFGPREQNGISLPG